MTKFSGKAAAKPNVKAATGTVSKSKAAPDTVTFEGGAGWTKDDKTALFSLAVTNMVGEKTFYEEGGTRDKRFIDLIHKVAKSDPEWIARFIPYLRDTMNMRSAAVVMAVETVRVLLGTKHGINLRNVVDSAVVRADEPAEILGYYFAEYGRNVPMPIKRGLADAANRVYNEHSAVKYDGLSRAVRIADVLEVAHPTPKDEHQAALFKYVIDRRRGREWVEEFTDPNTKETKVYENVKAYEALPVILKTNEIDNIPVEQRREKLLAGEIDFAGSAFTWERVSGWINGPMDAKVWEAIIPQMGYMALLRNLRNFEQAGISKATVEFVRNKLSDPAEVAKSRQFPYRFYSAYKNTNSFLWQETLEKALDLSTQNVPEFSGKTLVLVDVSGSMDAYLSNNSKIKCWEVGAVLAGVIGARGDGVDLVAFGTDSAKLDVAPATPALRIAEKIGSTQRGGALGWGTNTFPAIQKHFADHDRVIIVTDMQSHGYGNSKALLDKVTKKANIYNIDTRGYAQANMPTGEKGIFEFAGFNDQMFKAIHIIEQKKNAGWPF